MAQGGLVFFVGSTADPTVGRWAQLEMRRFQNILVDVPHFGLRDANPAVQHAAALAESNGAYVKLMCVHESFWTREDEEALENLAAPLRERGLRVSAEHPWGAEAEEVLRAVRTKEHDLVVKTASPDDAQKMAFGAVGIRLMRMCPCPVWIIQPSQTKPFRRVLATVDPQRGQEARQSLNVKILELATSLARLQNAEVHVLHAWSADREAPAKSNVANNALGQLDEATAADAHARLSELVSPFADSIPGDHIHLVDGDAAKVISRFAREHQVDIIVMGTVARTGIAGFVIGNTAERVLRRVACSVLTLKPDGLVSPIP